MKQSDTKKLTNSELRVINIGAEIFYHSLRNQGVKVIHVDWQPPAGGDLDLIKLLEKFSQRPETNEDRESN